MLLSSFCLITIFPPNHPICEGFFIRIELSDYRAGAFADVADMLVVGQLRSRLIRDTLSLLFRLSVA